jgi:hypothetical protein
MPTKAARKRGAVKLKTKKNLNKKRFKRVLSVVALTFSAFLLLSTYSIYKLVDRNLASALTPGKDSFDVDTYPTVLYVTAENLNQPTLNIKKLEFKIFDIEGERVFSYEVPVDYEIDMPGRLGFEKISNIFLVSELSNATTESTLEKGIQTLNSSLLPIFGLKAERYVVVDGTTSDKFDTFWKNGEITAFTDKSLLSDLSAHVRSDFSLKEFLKLAAFIRSLPSDRLNRKSLFEKLYSRYRSN